MSLAEALDRQKKEAEAPERRRRAARPLKKVGEGDPKKTWVFNHGFYHHQIIEKWWNMSPCFGKWASANPHFFERIEESRLIGVSSDVLSLWCFWFRKWTFSVNCLWFHWFYTSNYMWFSSDEIPGSVAASALYIEPHIFLAQLQNLLLGTLPFHSCSFL